MEVVEKTERRVLIQNSMFEYVEPVDHKKSMGIHKCLLSCLAVKENDWSSSNNSRGNLRLHVLRRHQSHINVLWISAGYPFFLFFLALPLLYISSISLSHSFFWFLSGYCQDVWTYLCFCFSSNFQSSILWFFQLILDFKMTTWS